MKCRSCLSEDLELVVDLRSQPLSNAFLTQEQLFKPETTYPLVAYVCLDCTLMQIGAYESRENIFNEEYVYFSGQSQDWLEHCQQYTKLMIERFNPSNALELASNDGSLLGFFQEAGLGVLGIEPSKSVADVALARGIDTRIEFFGFESAHNLNDKYDIIVANNVMAHVPDLNDFVSGIKEALSPKGVVTVEFPYVGNLLEELQFDTIYQEHFSYFSLGSSRVVFNRHELEIFDVDVLPTHGGSLRIYASHPGVYPKGPTYHRIDMLEVSDPSKSPVSLQQYRNFGPAVAKYKRDLLNVFTLLKNQGETIVAYGAPAKGNTLLNYCGIGTDFIDYCVDSTPYKQGKYLPGSHIPVYEPNKIDETRPSVVYIQPWNWVNEIKKKLEYTKSWKHEPKIIVRKNIETL